MTAKVKKNVFFCLCLDILWPMLITSLEMSMCYNRGSLMCVCKLKHDGNTITTVCT